MKTCAKCKVEQSKDNFYANAKAGLDGYCKPCRSEVNAAYYKQNPDYHRNYYHTVTKPRRQAAAAAREAAKKQG